MTQGDPEPYPTPSGSQDLDPTEVSLRPTETGTKNPADQGVGSVPEPAEPSEAGSRGSSTRGRTAGAGDPALVGQQLGPYRISKVLGRGGMGTVYLAQQERPLRRRVALKVGHPGLEDERSRAFFEAEQNALARMSHPYVTQVFDSGTTPSGAPWFAMEHIEGENITAYCDRLELGLRARLSLFLAVCEGIQHAHHKGIIHRDLKPSNILVCQQDGQPVPKVIDFGIAKDLDRPPEDDPAMTERWLYGTRGYLSPEVVTGDRHPDTRSDVYLLGLLLYELLAGELPFPRREGSFLEMLRRIVEEDAPPLTSRFAALGEERQEAIARARGLSPAQLRRRLTGDLEWITLRALSRDRENRYPSAASLALDIRRSLQNLPTSAAPPQMFDRFRKLARRHRAAVAAGLLVLASLVAGFVARTIEADRANREAQRANQEAQRAREAAATAQAVTAFLIDLFETNDPNRDRGDLVTARELLDRGADEIARSLEDEPLSRAAIMDSIGSLYNTLGHPEEGEKLINEALAIRRRLLPETAPEITESLRHVTMVRVEQGRFTEAEESVRELVAQCRLSGADTATLAFSLTQQAIVLHNLGRLEESEEVQRGALTLLEGEPQQTLVEDELHTALHHLGTLLLDTGRFEESLPLLDRALEIRSRTNGPDSDSAAQALNNLALANLQLDRFEKGAALLERAVAIREQRLGPDHPNLAWGLRLLSLARLETGQLEEAAEIAERSLAIQEATLGRRHPFTALSIEVLAKIRAAQKRFDEAEALARETLSIAEEKLEPDHLAWGYYFHTLANVLRDAGHLEEARIAYAAATERMTDALGKDHPDLAEVEADRELLDVRAAGD